MNDRRVFFALLRGKRQEAPVRVRAWVLAADETSARRRIEAELASLGLADLAFEACEATGREDYFAPCESLEAYGRAEREGSAYLITTA